MSAGYEFKKDYYARLFLHYDGALYALLIDSKQQDTIIQPILSDTIDSLVTLTSEYIKLSDDEIQNLRCYLEKYRHYRCPLSE